MKLATFLCDGRPTAGLVLTQGVVPIARAAQDTRKDIDLSSVLGIIRGGDPALDAVRRLAARAAGGQAGAMTLADAPLLAPIPALLAMRSAWGATTSTMSRRARRYATPT